MIKVTYSSDISSTVGVGGEIVKSASELNKQASTIFKCEYDALKPPEGMTGIHLVALGDSEAYPMNRNGDLFTKKACETYYPTFVKYGHVFEHHRNKDPKKSIGQIKAAAYNPDMHRIELYIWADNEKAHDHLERLEKTGEVSFSMACFRKGTLITTIRGCKPIEDIVVGDVVLTHAGNWKRVTSTMKRHADGYYRIRPESRRSNCVLEVTAEHPLLSTSYKDIKFKARRDSKEIPSLNFCRSKRRSLDSSLAWKPVKELCVRDFIVTPVPKRNIPDVDPISDINEARLLGYYLAEGSVYQGTVEFTCNIHDVAVKEIPNLRNWSSVRINPKANSEKAVSVSCHGGSPEKYFVRLVGRRCENKTIPAEIFAADDDVKLNFIATWFNGDGWQDKDGIHVSTSNPGLADQLTMLLASIGIESSSHYILHPAGRGLNLPENRDHVVNISNYYSGMFASISKAVEIQVTRKQSHAFIAGNYLMNSVKSIEYVDADTDVYNFSVEDDESYVANGFAVHNCTVPNDRCSVCGAIREKPGDASECDHIKYSLGKIAEDGTQIGTYNDHPRWFDISFVGRPADRIAWNLKVASAMPENLSINSSVKQAEIEGYVLPDDIAIESDSSKRKFDIMKKLARSYDELEAWLFGGSKPEGKDAFTFELRKLAGAKLDDESLSALRELDPKDAFAALGDAGVVMDTESFFKYAFGPNYNKVESYVPHVQKAASSVVREAVSSSSCAEFCNDSRFDARPYGAVLAASRPWLVRNMMKSAASCGFGTNDPVSSVMWAMASESVPEFSNPSEKSAGESCEDQAVVRKLAKKYAMYKIAALCAVLDRPAGLSLREDDVVFVAAAQDMRECR